MSASTSKLEMSLDDIIKAQKGKGNVQQGRKSTGGAGAKIRRGGPINKRRQVVMQRGKRQIGGINKNRGNQGKRLNITIPRKRIGGIRVLRKQPIRGNRIGGIRKNAAGNNRAVVSATKNLVRKLVKKAIAKNVVTSMAAARRGKVVRIPANRIRQRSILLNRISNRSRVIGRRPARVLVQNRSPVILQQQPAIVRGRGPIRYATGPVMQAAAPRIITLPKRRRNTIQYVQQQPVAFQQPRIFSPVIGQPQLSVRGQINAMRRATRVQQLNTQFLKQQSRPQPVIKIVRQQQQPMMGRRRQQQRQQVITVQQLPQQRRRQQSQRQPIIILQQQAPQQRRGGQGQGKFFGRGGRGGGQQRGPRGQQVIQLDPMYVPPNYLQRI